MTTALLLVDIQNDYFPGGMMELEGSCGMMTHTCVDETARAAFDYGSDCLVAGDACATRKLQFGDESIPAAHVHGPVLTLVFALLLLFAGFIGITGLAQRLRFEGAAARVPVYLAAEGGELGQLWPIIIVAAVGVVVGTLVGGRVLRRIPETVFRRVVSAIILALGFYMLFRASMEFTNGG